MELQLFHLMYIIIIFQLNLLILNLNFNLNEYIILMLLHYIFKLIHLYHLHLYINQLIYIYKNLNN